MSVNFMLQHLPSSWPEGQVRTLVCTSTDPEYGVISFGKEGVDVIDNVFKQTLSEGISVLPCHRETFANRKVVLLDADVDLVYRAFLLNVYANMDSNIYDWRIKDPKNHGHNE